MNDTNRPTVKLSNVIWNKEIDNIYMDVPISQDKLGKEKQTENFLDKMAANIKIFKEEKFFVWKTNI